jgi:hypothetical protein
MTTKTLAVALLAFASFVSTQGCSRNTSTLPSSFVGSYHPAEPECANSVITVTAGGLSASECRSRFAMPGSITFTRVACTNGTSCTFTSAECTGTITRGDDGSLLISASAAGNGTASNPFGGLAQMANGVLCNSFVGTARPAERGAHACSVTRVGAM